jgi:hypothetical protein
MNSPKAVESDTFLLITEIFFKLGCKRKDPSVTKGQTWIEWKGWQRAQ